MTSRAWRAVLLSLVSALAFAVPEGAVAQAVADRAGVSGQERPVQVAQGAGTCREVDCPCPAGLTRTEIGCIDCRAYNVACPPGTQGGFGGGASQSQGFGGAVDVGQSVAGGAAAGAGESDGNSKSQAQSAVDAINALGGGRTAGAETGAPQGWNGERIVTNRTNSGTRTPEQDFAVKTKPYFFEDKSKYYK